MGTVDFENQNRNVQSLFLRLTMKQNILLVYQ
jgi:hypothetical protein